MYICIYKYIYIYNYFIYIHVTNIYIHIYTNVRLRPRAVRGAFGTFATSSGQPLDFDPAAPARHFDLSCCSGTYPAAPG